MKIKKEMIFSKKIILVNLIVCILFLISLVSAIPQTFNIHGKLTDSSGNALSGTYDMSFRIYDAYTGGNTLWSVVDQSITTDSNGVYSTILNAINLSFSEQYYLGITVESDDELSPRTNLTSSGYTFRANVTDYLDATKSYEISNLTITQKITFAFGEIIDNIVDGWIRVTGNLNVTGNIQADNVTANYFIGDGSYLTNVNGSGLYVPYVGATSNVDLGANNFKINNSVFFVNSTNGRVGIGTAAPGAKLELYDTASSNGLLKIHNAPSGGDCPANMSYINKGGGYCIDNYEAVAMNADGSWNSSSDDNGWIATSTDALLANNGYAGSMAGHYPWVYIDQTEARTACERAGKYLCSSVEWMGAANVGGSIYNLAATISACTVSTNCILGNDLGPNLGDACYGGSMTGCVSSEGVYDMVGNVWEWTNETIDEVISPDGSANWFYINSTDLSYSLSSLADDGTYGKDGTYFAIGTQTNRAVLRGGSWSLGALAGPFCSNLYSGATSTNNHIGFRCCSVPN